MQRFALRALTVSLLFTLPFLAGCANHEGAIRERAKQLIGHLCRNEVDACLPFMEPAQLNREGPIGAKLRFGVMAALMKAGKLTEEDVRIDSVTVDSEKKSAFLVISLRQQGEWKSQPPYRWVRVDDKWYITF